MPDLDMALPTQPDVADTGNSYVGHETGSGNNFERKQMAKRFQRLPHIFDHARPKYDTADFARHRRHRQLKCRLRNRKWKPEVEITFEWKQMAKRFQGHGHKYGGCH